MLAHTVSAIGLTLALSINPAPILQTTPPGSADNPVRGADATVGWIVASGRDRSPTFDALVGRVAAAQAVVVVCWSARQAGSARLRGDAERTQPGATESSMSSCRTRGTPRPQSFGWDRSFSARWMRSTNEPWTARPCSRVGHAIRTELKTGT